MASTPSNLSELTVTCRQCGSASMERIGPREYRCTHCGAITVVSQDGTGVAPPPSYVAPPKAAAGPDLNDPTRNVLTPAQVAAANNIGRHVPLVLFLFCLLAAAGFVGLMHSCGGDLPPAGSATSEPTPTAAPAISASELSLSPVEWSTEGKATNGRYTGLIANRSNSALLVPSYTMNLYLRGALVDTAQSTVPLGTLLPGEYEPISFAFKSPSDDPHPEITPPALADLARVYPVRLQFGERQLIRENGKLGYRLVGVVNNTSTTPAKNIVAAVMLFDSSHSLLGFGSYKVNRALRAGERTAIQVDIATSNVNPVASYEYLLDAAPDTP